MRRDFENTIDERTAVQGDNKLDNNKEKKYLCPRLGDIREFVEKDKIEERTFNQYGQQDERFDIPSEYTFFWISRRPLHNIRVRGGTPRGQGRGGRLLPDSHIKWLPVEGVKILDPLLKRLPQ